MLCCAGLSKKYGKLAVLSECEVSVPRGACVTIRGPSGGGKSTLLRILALLEPPDSGIVRHDDKTYSFSADAQEQQFPMQAFPYLTMVFQQLYLWPHLTIRENVAIVLNDDWRSALNKEALELFQRLQITAILDQKPHECSLGQRQRAAIARAVLTCAPYILLDEPTSALDQRNREILIDVLMETKVSGRGLLIVTHDERDFEEIADENFILEDGSLKSLRCHIPAVRP